MKAGPFANPPALRMPVGKMPVGKMPGRQRLLADLWRVLKPGGSLIFVDSPQTGDEPDYDALVDYFPFAFYEPYYAC